LSLSDQIFAALRAFLTAFTGFVASLAFAASPSSHFCRLAACRFKIRRNFGQ
jgi:hypothetical protein